MLCFPSGCWVTEDLVNGISCFKWQASLLPLSVTTLCGEAQLIQAGRLQRCKHIQYLWCTKGLIIQCHTKFKKTWVCRNGSSNNSFNSKTASKHIKLIQNALAHQIQFANIYLRDTCHQPWKYSDSPFCYFHITSRNIMETCDAIRSSSRVCTDNIILRQLSV